MKKILLALVLIIIIGYSFSFFNNMGPATGQVKMNKEIVAGTNGKFVLKKDSIVNVSKEYFLPQILLPGSIGGMKRFDTPPPLYTQIGTGVYFSGRDATEVVPFKGKPRGGTVNVISAALSLGYALNQLIVLITFILLFILIKRVFRTKNIIINNENNIKVKKKKSYYIPVVIVIFILSFIYPFSRVTLYLGVPLMHLVPDPEQPFIDELKLEEKLFPTEPDPSGQFNNKLIDNSEYERMMEYNYSQSEKRFEYRRTHPLKGNTSIIVSMMYHFSGQVTLLFLIIIFSILRLFISKNKSKQLLVELNSNISKGTENNHCKL